MKILVVPDVHCRKFWRKAVDENIGKVDKIVFLGDYIDPYPIEIEERPESMECEDFYDVESLLKMLNDILELKKNNPDKYVLLTGNHTDSYIWNNFASATRTDYRNYKTYQNFFRQNLNFFNLVYIQDNTIFSHAGITKAWAEEVWNIMKYPENEPVSIKEIATLLQDTPLENFNKRYLEALNYISYYRNGLYTCGSCEWADLREHTNINEENIYQVFGHTQLKSPIITDNWACLDCKKTFIIDTLTHKIEDGSNSSL